MCVRKLCLQFFREFWSHFQGVDHFHKCHFCKQETAVLGMIVGPNYMQASPKKMHIIQDWPIPKDRKMVHSFLGLMGYFWRFIQGYADIAQPLNRLLTQEWIWTKESQVFTQLQLHMMSELVMAMLVHELLYTLLTDTSHFLIGALLQHHHNGDWVVAYASWTLSPEEQNYSTT